MPVLIGLLVTWLLWDPPAALAWGPSTHVELAGRLLSSLSPAAGAAAALITRYARDFLYGNIAADVIQAKNLAEAKKHCHSWPVGLALLDKARNEQTRAFALGYLCHLAADCVAHNKFVPRQMTLSRSRTTFSHIYWEMRADATVPRPVWQEMRSLVKDHWPDHDGLLEDHLVRPLFSFRWNKRMFTRVSLASSARPWRNATRVWALFSRYSLPPTLMSAYHAESVARMKSVLTMLDQSPVTAEDPVGSVSFENVRVTRRLLRQMASAGILRPQVLREAVAHFAPSEWTDQPHPTRTRHAS